MFWNAAFMYEKGFSLHVVSMEQGFYSSTFVNDISIFSVKP